MSLSCNQINRDISFSPRSLEIISKKDILIKINNIDIDAIIKNILSDFCNANVIGYEKSTNIYWCKMYEDKFCQLHIEIEIINTGFEQTQLKICPLYGTSKSIENFVSNFKESIQLYNTSSFIRKCLEGYRGL
jgi:hypothetical protein